MEPNEALQILIKHQAWRLGKHDEATEPKDLTEAMNVAIQALESVSKADNWEVKNVEDIFKKSTKKNMVFYDHKNFGLAYPSLLKAIYEAMHEYHNQFLSVKVSDEEIEKEAKEWSPDLSQYEKEYFEFGAKWMRSRMSNNLNKEA